MISSLSHSLRPGGASSVRRYTARAGAATIEFAIVGPVFLFILLGLVEVGRALMVQSLLINAARDGARVGVLEGKGNTDITNAVNTGLSGLGISGDSVQVQVNGVTADASTASANDEITVTVSVPVSSITWLPVPRFLSGTIYGQYTLRRE